MQQKIQKKRFFFSDNCIWIGIVKLSLLRATYFSSAVNVLTRCPKIWHVYQTDFFEHNFVASDQSMWWRCCSADFSRVWANLQYCFWKYPLKLEFLDIYLTTFLESVTLKIQNIWGSSFYSKCLKFNVNFKNAEKNREIFFCFWDNCIWIRIFRLSLLRTGYLWSAANVLTNWCCDGDFNSVWARLPSCLSNHPLKRDLLDIYLTEFLESVILKLQNLWGGSFYAKCFSEWSKFNLNWKNFRKNAEKVICLWDNCIWIGIVKLSLLRTGYFSSAANVLRSSLKISHVAKRDFLQLNFLGSNRWIW